MEQASIGVSSPLTAHNAQFVTVRERHGGNGLPNLIIRLFSGDQDRLVVRTLLVVIGEAAKVPLATIYRLFGSERGILSAVLDVAFVGDDEPLALHDRNVGPSARPPGPGPASITITAVSPNPDFRHQRSRHARPT